MKERCELLMWNLSSFGMWCQYSCLPVTSGTSSLVCRRARIGESPQTLQLAAQAAFNGEEQEVGVSIPPTMWPGSQKALGREGWVGNHPPHCLMSSMWEVAAVWNTGSCVTSGRAQLYSRLGAALGCFCLRVSLELKSKVEKIRVKRHGWAMQKVAVWMFWCQHPQP